MDWLQQWMDKLTGAPGWVLVGIGCLAIGLTLKKIKAFPNQAIPLVLILIGILGSIFLAAEEPKGMGHRSWVTRQAFIGLIIAFTAWGFHHFVLKQLALKFPWLKPIISEWDTQPPFKNPDSTKPTNDLDP